MSAESKEHFLSRMDSAWPAFSQVLEAIPEVEFDRSGVVDEWCLKELLGHVNFWAEKAGHDVRAVAAGRPDDVQVPAVGGGVDEWNAREAARGKLMAAADLKAAVSRAHEDARRAVAEAPESVLAVEIKGWTVGHRAAEDTYRHYDEHAAHVREWQRRLETTEE